METSFLGNVIGGLVSLILGIILLYRTVADTRKGNIDPFGSYIKLYTSSIILIMMGLVLINRWLF